MRLGARPLQGLMPFHAKRRRLRRTGNAMAKVKCRAVIMDYAGQGESTYEFDAEDNLFQQPADEIVEVFMNQAANIRGVGPVRYELNAASRYDDKKVVLAMGALFVREG